METTEVPVLVTQSNKPIWQRALDRLARTFLSTYSTNQDLKEEREAALKSADETNQRAIERTQYTP